MRLKNYYKHQLRTKAGLKHCAITRGRLTTRPRLINNFEFGDEEGEYSEELNAVCVLQWRK